MTRIRISTAPWPSLAIVVFSGLGLSLCGCTDPVAEGGDGGKDVPPAAAQSSEEPTLKERLDEVINFNERRFMNSRDHAAWQIMHGLLAYPNTLKIYEGEPGEKKKPQLALNWLLEGGAMRGWNLMPGEKGLNSLLEGGSKTGQGHDDQWLAVLAQAKLDPGKPIKYRGTTYTMKDLIRQAQWDVKAGAEMSWTIIGLNQYLSFDDEWDAAGDDEKWSLARIVEEEASQELNESACGGSHRLIGMAMVLERYKKEGHNVEGPWAKAEEKINTAFRLLRRHQQPDGAFSTEYLKRPASTNDVARRINTTGHTLEFLAIALPQERLKEEWVERGALHLCKLLKQTKNLPVECGSLYHAIHGLQIYRKRRFGE